MIANLNLTTDQQRPQQPTYYSVRMDSRYPSVLVLTPEDTRPEKLEHFFDTAAIHKHMQENFGPDVKQLPGSKFQKEVERRAVHTPEMQNLLMQNSLGGQDLTQCFVYGSRRPMGTWAGIEQAAYIQVDPSTGFHTYVVVPAQLDMILVGDLELVFVSHP